MSWKGRRNRAVFEATVYHDEPEEAAVASETLGYFPSLGAAEYAINEARLRSPEWQTGGIRYGWLWEAVLGVQPEEFEPSDVEVPWFVGTDGKADR
jgi:hypothetical protein